MANNHTKKFQCEKYFTSKTLETIDLGWLTISKLASPTLLDQDHRYRGNHVTLAQICNFKYDTFPITLLALLDQQILYSKLSQIDRLL